jgi:hypothetical protein
MVWIECRMEEGEAFQAAEIPVFIKAAQKRHNFRATICTRCWLIAAA